MKIYRYLLLDPPDASLKDEDQRWLSDDSDDETSDESDNHLMDNDYWRAVERRAFADGNICYEGECAYDSFGFNFCEHNRSDRYRHMADERTEQKNHSARAQGHKNNERRKFKCRITKRRMTRKSCHENRHTAILLVNRQINREAYTVLYRELTMLVDTWDILPKTLQCDPKPGVGSTDNNGENTGIPKAWHGSMEPHVFSRFSKITFGAHLNFQSDDRAPPLHLDDNLNVQASDVQEYLNSYQTSLFFKISRTYFSIPRA